MKTRQTTINRSGAKWLPGAMALAATAASSQAATVQITLTGNKISSAGGNQLVADLTGDATPDVTLASVNNVPSRAMVRVNGEWIFARYIGSTFDADAMFHGGGVGVATSEGYTVQISASYLNPIIFTDAGINGGLATSGWLQVNAFNTSQTSHTVELSRLIFDNASTARPGYTAIPGVQPEWSATSAVPEASTSLGLLALGAGGLLTRRRQKRAA